AGGEVLFDVQSMPDYGALSGRKLDEQLAGARVAVDAHKKNPADFVLWKLSSENEPGWDSPWGRGRPGWHIECSAMSAAYLGNVFDIHGGGLDLIFPHHENEIAQSRCAHGTATMANYWMHNGFLEVEGAKMSKSLGNFVTIRELLETDKFGGRRWPGEVLRLAMLKTHYRQPIDWTVNALEEAEANLKRWHDFEGASEIVSLPSLPSNVIRAVADDLNMSQAISELHVLRRTGQLSSLVTSLKFLGLFNSAFSFDRNHIQDSDMTPENRETIESWIAARTAARARKDFKESDRIRDELAAVGVVLKDGKDANGEPTTTWEVAR
ncbi:MAG: cysteine--tRNA ligase, partial [Xanthobacteraceae bacterium]